MRVRLVDPVTGSITALTGDREFLELIAGTNVTLTLTEKTKPGQPKDDAISITITSSGAGSGSYG